MKKIKIMLLSLALFAVVGGALAFKAKYIETFCTADAYSDNTSYYCTFSDGKVTTTKECDFEVENSTTSEAQVLPVCTTEDDPFRPCTELDCPEQTSIKTDQ